MNVTENNNVISCNVYYTIKIENILCMYINIYFMKSKTLVLISRCGYSVQVP